MVNLCDMKFSGDAYVVERVEELKLRRRIEVLKETQLLKHTVHLTLITTYSMAYDKHSSIGQKQVVMDE